MADQSVLHKRLLGTQLNRLREDAKVTLEEAGDRLGRTTRTVRRFEDGDTLPDKLQLDALCDLYGVDPEVRKQLESLRELARQPVWWSHLGPRPPATSAMLAMESTAHRIRDFDHNAIPGLLQTTSYTANNIRAVEPGLSPQQVESAVKLRTERQARIWQRENPPEAHFLIDEAALWRIAGSGESKRAQFSRLLPPFLAPTVTIQIVPFSAGPHPSLGTYRIFDLDLDSNTGIKGVYVEGSATQQGVIIENESEIAQYELVFEQTRAKAYSPSESARYIKERIRGIADD